MIRTLSHLGCTCVLLTACAQVRADDPITLVWSTIAGGGGTMSADGFELSSTVGQAQVSGVLTDGTFSLYNGYWVPSTATIRSRCAADFNNDGTLDFFDYDAFVQAFEGGDPSADINWDGTIDFFDYDAFIGYFEAGC